MWLMIRIKESGNLYFLAFLFSFILTRSSSQISSRSYEKRISPRLTQGLLYEGQCNKYRTILFPSKNVSYATKHYNSIFVNHNLRLYRISFLLSRIENLSSFIICRSWYLLFYMESTKDRKPARKYFSTSSWVRSLFV